MMLFHTMEIYHLKIRFARKLKIKYKEFLRKMQIRKFEIEGLLLIEPRLFQDDRGFFFESYNAIKYAEILGEGANFVQDNISVSNKHVLRGLHFQESPFAQGKLVTVLQGKVLDIAVDIRKNSKTYGQYQSIELSSENNYQFWIPPGFAHGFLSLEENTLFSYKCTICGNDYRPKSRWGSLKIHY